jgi:hypothetical protein
MRLLVSFNEINNGWTYSVGGEDDVRSLQETGTQHVAKGVVFLVESEDTRGGQTWRSINGIGQIITCARGLTSVDFNVDLILIRAEQNGLVAVGGTLVSF